MGFLPEIEVFRVASAMCKVPPGFWPLLSPDAGRFALVLVISGMKRGELRLADGGAAYVASGRLDESVMLAVPPGGVFDCEFDEDATEAYVFEFACPDLAPNPSRMRLALKCGDGSRQTLFLATALSSYEDATLRPIAEQAHHELLHGDTAGKRIYGHLNFMALLARLFVVPRSIVFWGNPAVVFTKNMEANPRGLTLKEVSRKLGCSPGTIRRRLEAIEPGKTPKYIRQRQTLHLMRHYILRTTLPFKTVARHIGFGSASQFTHYCVRHTGRTPREIRSSGKWPL